MKMDWTKYEELCVSYCNRQGMVDILRLLVESYLYGSATTQMITELKSLGILLETTEEKKKIVEPFNFMGDGTQSS